METVTEVITTRKAHRREYQRQWRLDNPEKDRASAVRSYAKKTKEEHAEISRLWKLANPEKVKATNRRIKLKRQYGLTIEDYNAMLDSQNGVCKICGMPETKMQRRGSDTKLTPESLHVDHDHATGKIRGLLCYKCNTALGKFDDNPELFRRAIAYLRGEL